MSKLEKAINMLYKDGINGALISAMTDTEILKAFEFEDYGEYNQYMNYMSRKYNI